MAKRPGTNGHTDQDRHAFREALEPVRKCGHQEDAKEAQCEVDRGPAVMAVPLARHEAQERRKQSQGNQDQDHASHIRGKEREYPFDLS